jgi:D-glycero-alpha-D-manno-heptose-7-phosphate kinase
MAEVPDYLINSVAPIRICDNGGWTDTWFAQHGRIFNIAVSPYAHVQVAVYSRREHNTITLHVLNFGDHYVVDPLKHWNKHPLLEATIESMQIPPEVSLEITVFSEAPSGASTGTSAAVTVALVGALAQLSSTSMSRSEIAYAAHRVETELLHQQSGIQDQLCSAYGGINYIEMLEYPQAAVSPILIPETFAWELEQRLVLIYLGKSHQSSSVHHVVIQSLKNAGPDCAQLEDLRSTADRSREALKAQDLFGLGLAMIENTQAQARLHASLIGIDAKAVIDIARSYGALGWKVNGAGGEGGSLTILCGHSIQARHEMIRAIEETNPLYKNIPIHLSKSGLRVWKMNPFDHIPPSLP